MAGGQLVHYYIIFLSSLDVVNIEDQCRDPSIKKKDHLAGKLNTAGLGKADDDENFAKSEERPR